MNPALLRAVLLFAPRLVRAAVSVVPPKVRRVLTPLLLVASGVLGAELLPSAPPPPVVTLEDVCSTAVRRDALDALVARLQEALPTPVPVTVRLAPLRQWGALGRTFQLPSGERAIVLDSDLDGLGLSVVLMHEWAHAMSSPKWDPTHGPEWALRFGQVYRWWVGE